MRTTLVFELKIRGNQILEEAFRLEPPPPSRVLNEYFLLVCSMCAVTVHTPNKKFQSKTGPQKVRNPWSLTGTLNILTNRIIVVGLAGSKYKSYLSHEKKFGVVEFHPVASDHFW